MSDPLFMIYHSTDSKIKISYYDETAVFYPTDSESQLNLNLSYIITILSLKNSSREMFYKYLENFKDKLSEFDKNSGTIFPLAKALNSCFKEKYADKMKYKNMEI